ncbi:MAG: 3D domain-containing protein [Bacillota bacterium]
MRFLDVALALVAALVVAVPPAEAPATWRPLPRPAENLVREDLQLVVEATAYSYGCGNGDGVTATGTPVRWGVVAVDPQIIPLGSRVEIAGLGVFQAEDTGGAIKGSRIDIWMPSRGMALQWGRRTVTVKF